MTKLIQRLLSKNTIGLLDGFSYEEMVELLSMGDLEEYSFRDIIMRERRNDPYLYVIVKGEVSMWKRNVPIFNLREGDVFNLIKIFQPIGNSMTAISEASTSVLKIKREYVLEYFASKSERLLKIFTLNAILLLHEHLKECEDQLISLYYQSMHMMKDIRSA